MKKLNGPLTSIILLHNNGVGITENMHIIQCFKNTQYWSKVFGTNTVKPDNFHTLGPNDCNILTVHGTSTTLFTVNYFIFYKVFFFIVVKLAKLIFNEHDTKIYEI